jgi:hypothetical protein
MVDKSIRKKTMSDLLQDIDEAIKRENAEKFWKENGPYLLGGAVLLVLMTAVFTAYNTWQTNRNAQQTAIIVQAMQAKPPETALAESLKDLKGQHKAMAMLQLAGLQAQAGKTNEALKLYRDVAADRSLPSLWRDLATLNAARSEWNGTLDQAKAKALFDSLKPLTAAKNPWHLQAAIQAAMIAGDNLGDYDTAIKLLRGPITDPSTPPDLKARAQALDHLYLNTTAQHKADNDKAAPKG